MCDCQRLHHPQQRQCEWVGERNVCFTAREELGVIRNIFNMQIQEFSVTNYSLCITYRNGMHLMQERTVKKKERKKGDVLVFLICKFFGSFSKKPEETKATSGQWQPVSNPPCDGGIIMRLKPIYQRQDFIFKQQLCSLIGPAVFFSGPVTLQRAHRGDTVRSPAAANKAQVQKRRAIDALSAGLEKRQTPIDNCVSLTHNQQILSLEELLLCTTYTRHSAAAGGTPHALINKGAAQSEELITFSEERTTNQEVLDWRIASQYKQLSPLFTCS